MVKFLRNAGNELAHRTCHNLEDRNMHVYRRAVVKTLNFKLLSSFIWWKNTTTCIVT